MKLYPLHDKLWPTSTQDSRHPKIQSQDSRMKPKYAVVFICIVALVIIEKESNIISRYENEWQLDGVLFFGKIIVVLNTCSLYSGTRINYSLLYYIVSVSKHCLWISQENIFILNLNVGNVKKCSGLQKLGGGIAMSSFKVLVLKQ